MARRPVMEDVPDTLILSQFKGLRNTTSAERLEPGEFINAENVIIDDAAQIHRRRGFNQLVAGNFHSLYDGADERYIVKDGTLGILNDDYSFTSLGTAAADRPIAYVTIGDITYFSSEIVSGKIEGSTVSAWGAIASDRTWVSPVVNPTSTLTEIRGDLLASPPMATILTYYNGRIYLAEGTTIWATELFLYDYVEVTSGFLPFENNITIMGAVADGIYVGTETDIWFLSGTRVSELRRIRKRNEGAVKGTLVNVPQEIVSPEESQLGDAVVFRTDHSVVAGFPGGVMYDLTERKTWLPLATSGAGLFLQQDGVNQYIGVADSGGTPSSAAQIGDYVDAEIIRFGGA